MTSPLKTQTYDIIICGGGTAGCVLAARLSEDPNLSILLIEAGVNANKDPLVSTPGLFPLLMDNPDRDWQFMSEPSPGLNGRKIPCPRGKCLGGSSAVNLMALVYPSKASLDVWAELGNEGWDWESMVPYFQKFQRKIPPSREIKEALSLDFLDLELQEGTHGPIASSYPQTFDPLQKAWVDTWKGLQKHITGDPMAGTFSGGYTSTATVDPEKAERSHAGVGYLEPVMGRENLEVVTEAMIERVEFDGGEAEGVVANGVTFTHAGQHYTAHASKEVILTAGVIGSPAILERSGIGCKKLCGHLGIENVIDNPHVGENLQDHLMCGASFEVNDGVATADAMRDPATVQKVMEAYQTSKSGPLAGGGGYSFAYTPLLDFLTPLSSSELKDLLDKHLSADSDPEFKSQKQHQAFARRIIENPRECSSSLCFITVQFHGEKEAVKDVFGISEPENYITLLPQLAHPFSRGSVHVQSKEAQVYPIVKPNYFSHPLDAEIMGRHMMQIETFASSPPFSTFLKPNGRRLPPGKDALTLENSIDFLRAAATSNYHQCGTCAMMPEELGGVVNERLKVHGTRNLRVCDASVFPVQVRGNIQSTVYAVAEKGADLLMEEFGTTRR